MAHNHLQLSFCRQCNYTATTQKPFTGLYSGVSVDLTHSSAHNTAAAQAAYNTTCAKPEGIPSSVAPPPIPEIPPPRRTLYRSAQPPYYNKVYKGAPLRPCYGFMPDSAAYHRPCQPGGLLPGIDGQRADSTAGGRNH